ncbi:copper resistance system multicopper oxidase [Anaeromyxobacter sp. Fw109-5]|uniref:copper resistance system multicopper oxidase n=1 Tax=Anaeromyxobacter sp. (strain Fw109-5) TaxID=404589 RepID=UPI0000ED6ECB|nr:copper resistance system multicopper oxidase [Anaeromyxobacter sp. Fw109-5]ABS28445.1 copper-resistance protein, CopA family [Anaeromyxobacter sp. Fw109-5]
MSEAPGAHESNPRGGITRRRFVQCVAQAGAAVSLGLAPGREARARPAGATGAPPVLDASAGPIDLRVERTRVEIGGRRGEAVTLNGVLPAPLLRFQEGREAVIRVLNTLDEDTSIHWHGVLVPNAMDGVPQVNFPGIRPGETFVYRFPVRQYGTYWYHAHSAFQEQLGHYGPLVIEPRRGSPFTWDREHVVLLSDWTFEDPHRIFAKLKKQPDYYNFQKRTVGDFFRDLGRKGLGATLRDRAEWGRMNMNPTDLADVTGATYTYLVNGIAPDGGWTASFRPGERVLLRFINASASTFFDVRVPGLAMKVVEVSGQWVEPVDTEEIRIAIAETYAVLVEPSEDRAYAIFAEALDRSGFAQATLAPRAGLRPPTPERRRRALLTMADMGMAHGAMGGMEGMQEGGRGHGGERAGGAAHAGHAAAASAGPRPPGALPEPRPHGPDSHGPGNAAIPMMTRSRLEEPGIGLGDDGRAVLTYAALRAREPRPDFRAPDREIELHLTGNMERFMWSIDGVKYSDAEPIRVRPGERIRLTLVNDTMMNHPMHLHGMWMELENGHGERIPRVHTVNVKPAERMSLLFTADAPGPWAFHCHVLYHMEAGMFRVVQVSERGATEPARREERGAEEPGHDHG